MATFEYAISHAEDELAQVQSALDAAQHVLETADRVHRRGKRLARLIRSLGRMAAVVLVVGGIAVAAAVVADRISRRPDVREEDDAVAQPADPGPSGA